MVKLNAEEMFSAIKRYNRNVYRITFHCRDLKDISSDFDKCRNELNEWFRERGIELTWADARAQWPPDLPEVALQEINTPIEQQTAAPRPNLIETYKGPLYAIGIEHKENEFDMVHGPTPNLQEMLDVLAPYTLLCHPAYSRASSLAEAKCFILELKMDKEGIARHKKLYKWNNKDFSWDRYSAE